MDHEETLIIGPMGVLHDRLQMLCPRRDGVEGGIEPRKILIPLLKLALTPTAELRAVIKSDVYMDPDIVSPEPKKNNGQKHKAKSSTKLMGVCGKADPCCHIYDIPLIEG
jgi:hypothetical protein